MAEDDSQEDPIHGFHIMMDAMYDRAWKIVYYQELHRHEIEGALEKD